MKTLTVVLLTYGRLEYAKRTVDSFFRNVKWSGDLRFHIASDGDEPPYQLSVASVAALATIDRKDINYAGFSESNSHRRGYGANWNLATQVVHEYSDYVLPLEDDWELTRELDADRLIAGLDALAGGCLRLGYVGYTQSLRGEFVYANGDHYLRLDPSSSEPHVFAGHPRIETVAWERMVGPWPENLSPGETEFQVAHIENARKYVYWNLDYVKPSGDLFSHIGTLRSY